MPAFIWKEETDAIIRAMWNDEKPARVISDKLGIPIKVVYRRAKVIGCKPRECPISVSVCNHDQLELIRKLWPTGMSTLKIGKEVGVSKGVVIGQIRTLKLPRRPSPIKNRPVTTTPPRTPFRMSIYAASQEPKPRTTVPKPAPAPVILTATAKIAYLSTRTANCCWPIGEPKSKDFRFCDAVTEFSKSYCDEHRKKSYARLTCSIIGEMKCSN